MDEAVWLYNHSNLQNGLEVGYFSGWWPYGTGGWFSGLIPYITFDNGRAGARASSGLPPSSIIMNVKEGSSGFGNVGQTHFTFNYSVPNGVNMGQGEVTISHASWLDDGAGNHTFAASWSNDGINWVGWGWHDDCQNSPYWITSVGASVYKNGGWGN